jgi:hypothetical protein
MLIHMLLCFVFRLSRGIHWRMFMRNGGMKLPATARVNSLSPCTLYCLPNRGFEVRRFPSGVLVTSVLDIWIVRGFGC